MIDRVKTPRTEFSIELEPSTQTKKKMLPSQKETKPTQANNFQDSKEVKTKSILKISKKVETTEEKEINNPQNSPRFGYSESGASVAPRSVAISETEYLINDVSQANNEKSDKTKGK